MPFSSSGNRPAGRNGLARLLSRAPLPRLLSGLAALTLPVLTLPVRAHHGPEEMIELLSRRMEAGGATPVLLYRRAIEWRILGDYERALGDLERAILMDPDFGGAILLQAEVFLLQGEPAKARASAQAGADAGIPARDRAGCQMVWARALLREGRLQEALDRCDAAFDSFPGGEIDWYLIRGGLQRRLGLHAERIAGFQVGHERTRSVVLRNAALDALIDAGRAAEALPMIEEQVAACRLKSSWLLRRARARLSLGETMAAREDLQAAIAELELRLHPTTPDVTLVVDRGVARAAGGCRGREGRSGTRARPEGRRIHAGSADRGDAGTVIRGAP